VTTDLRESASVTDGVTGEISSKGAREGTHRPVPNYKITWTPNHNNKRFNVSARSDARQPTDGQLVARSLHHEQLIIAAAVVATVTATAVAAASSSF